MATIPLRRANRRRRRSKKPSPGGNRSRAVNFRLLRILIEEMNMPFLLHQLLTESAERNPSQTAVVGLGGSLTYEQLERLSNQIAHQLREGGVQPGDRAGLLLDKRGEGVAGGP